MPKRQSRFTPQEIAAAPRLRDESSDLWNEELGDDLVRWYRLDGPDSPEQLGEFYSDLALKMVMNMVPTERVSPPSAAPQNGYDPGRSRITQRRQRREPQK